MYQIRDLKAFYNEPYTEANVRWRELCAIDKARHIVQLLGSRMSGLRNCLDVGCGTGDVSAFLAKVNLNVNFLGVEIGTPRQNIDPRFSSLTNLKILGFDGEHLPFDNASFDLVFASHVLEHVLHERTFLKELRRVARHFVLIEVPCEITARSSQISIQKGLDIGHINFYTPESFAGTLETCGLKIIQLQAFDISLEAAMFHGRQNARIRHAVTSSLLRVSPKLASKLFIYHYCALCRPAQLLTLDDA